MSLINKPKVKAFTMEAAQGRAHRFTRVGASFYITCDTNLKLFIRAYLHRHPSKGKTIR